MKKKNKLLRWLIIIVVVLIVFAIIGKKAGWIGGEEKKMVAVEKVTKRTIFETVSASGKIQPEVEVKISPDVSGEIVELYVKEGQRVKKGDLLAKILPDIYQSIVDQMFASVNSTRASLESAKARLVQTQSQFQRTELNYNRNKKLYDEKLISASDWETIKSSYEVAKAEVDAAVKSVDGSEYNLKSSDASLKQAQDNLKKTTIFAPVDATISKLNVEKGERVVGTSQMAGTEMMRLANLNEMEVDVEVNENDIVRVNIGDTATIDVDAYLGKKFQGVVTSVANSANTTGISADQVTNFTVKVRILRESYQAMSDSLHLTKSVFNPGMSATVDIQTKKVADVISVPIQSVTTRDTTQKGPMGMNNGDQLENDDALKVTNDKNKTTKKEEDKKTECVFVVENGKVKLTPVKPGIQDNSYIEIKEGLKEGQEVVTSPYSAIAKMLKNGDAVEVVKKEKLFSNEKK
ncbi:MAG: efflux RND transporter periplasmic adaptor subunit [Bacteroidetes bacterium]|nr:efflux RND transporter periplasmic adaptor subunit [Bacteroidota bacterium]